MCAFTWQHKSKTNPALARESQAFSRACAMLSGKCQLEGQFRPSTRPSSRICSAIVPTIAFLSLASGSSLSITATSRCRVEWSCCLISSASVGECQWRGKHRLGPQMIRGSIRPSSASPYRPNRPASPSRTAEPGNALDRNAAISNILSAVVDRRNVELSLAAPES